MGACFSLGWLENFLIWLVVVLVIVGIIKLLVPAVMNIAGGPPGSGTIMTILSYILWGVIAVFVIVFVFDLVSCALNSNGGFRLPR